MNQPDAGSSFRRATYIAPLVLLAVAVAIAVRAGTPEIKDAVLHAYFSPKGGCTAAVVDEIDKAKSTMLIQAYSFTSKPIAEALVNAHKRGVKIEVILDKSQRTEKYSECDFICHAGIPTLIDAQHEIAHNKIIIIDNETVITGSFNFTRAAEDHNAENLLVIKSKALAEQYTANWKEHAGHSDVYEKPVK
jgi:phosphatidylserine/phosphatidylglycerophosphate/cardiolipin synthase-like enzyme